VNNADSIDLARGWAMTTLAALRPARGGSVDPRKQPGGSFELYSVTNFPLGKPEILKGSEIGSNKQAVGPGTVLMCGINPRINRVWVVSKNSGMTQIASTEWISFPPTAGILPEYVCYFLQQNRIRDYLSRRASGVGGSLMRVKASTCADLPFPLAPFGEQRRIVEEIDKQFTRLEAGVGALKRVQANLKRYRAAVLKAAVEGRLVPTEAELARREGRPYEPASELLKRVLTQRRARWEAAQLAKFRASSKGPKDDKSKSRYQEPHSPDSACLPEVREGWTWAAVSQLGFVGSGQTPKGVDQRVRPTGETPWFKVGDMNRAGNERYMVEAASWICASDAAELGLHIHPAGTIIFPKRGGAIATNKKRILARPSGYDLNTMGVTPVVENVAGYLWWWFAGVDLSTLGDGSNVPQINHGDIEPLRVPLPPLAEQHRIVAEVERRLSVIDELEMQVEANLKRAERLRQAILKRAFEGKLVPQDPNDEPASVLLERICAQRAAQHGEARNVAKKRVGPTRPKPAAHARD
jgi:type I restriction enzyme S subunit